MIIIKIMGGLGNQIFQYATAKAIAIKKNDVLKLDINSFKNDSFKRDYKLDNFNIKEDIANFIEIRKLRGTFNITEKFCNKFKLNVSKANTYYKEQKQMFFDRDIFNKNSNLYLDGYWQNENYFSNIREYLLKVFIPKSISNIAREYLNEIQKCNSISLHIRRKDYLNLKDIYYICELDYYQKAIQIIQDKVENPKFFIFSDDIDWCKNNLNIEAIYIENTTDIEDMYLMKNCKHNIIANSTFSWWGAWLNENKNKIVIGPKKWFVKKEWQNLNLVSDEWVKI
jgi:hypothetical protein